MKRLILSTIMTAMLAVPAIEAQAAPRFTSTAAAQQANVEFVGQRHVDRRVVKKHVVKKKVVGKSHWERGQKYSAWKRHQAVRDWNRRGLRRPSHGQEWIRVGNDYLLVGIVSGVIAGLVAAQ